MGHNKTPDTSSSGKSDIQPRKKHKRLTSQNTITNSTNNGLNLSTSPRDISIQRNVIWPETEQLPANTNRTVKQNKIRNRKRSIRRLCLLVCVATITALVLATIAAVVILKTKATTVSTATMITTETMSTISTTSNTTSSSTSTTPFTISPSTSLTSSSNSTSSTTTFTSTSTSTTASETTITTTTSETTVTTTTSETTITTTTSETTITTTTSETTVTTTTTETTITTTTSETTITTTTSETTVTTTKTSSTSSSSSTTSTSTTTTTTTACPTMFLAQTTYSTGTGSNPSSVAVVDVNSDNKPDIVVADYTTNNIGIFLNAGNGTFLPQTTYSTGAGSNPRSVAVADVNGDSKPDIIVAEFTTNNVGVFLNTGNGTFLAQTTYSTGAVSNPRPIVVADVNGDSKLDIIVGDYTSNNIGVFLNTGNGTFLAQTTYSTGAGSNPTSVTVADVNNDNKPDIVVADYTSNNIGIFFNTGNGTFVAQITYSTGAFSNPRSVEVMDVNNDNKPDIVVAEYTTNNVGIFLNTGNGTFLPQITYSTGVGSNPRSATVVDVNGDSKPDIVAAYYTSNTVGVFLNAGNGTFLPQTTYSTGAGSNPYSAVVVDVNNDNKPDIIVAEYSSNNIGVLLHC